MNKSMNSSGMNAGPMMSESTSINPYYANKELLLEIIMRKLDISEDDMRDTQIVKSKVRNSVLNEVLESFESDRING